MMYLYKMVTQSKTISNEHVACISKDSKDSTDIRLKKYYHHHNMVCLADTAIPTIVLQAVCSELNNGKNRKIKLIWIYWSKRQ